MHSLHRSSQVRVLDEKRELVGVFSTADALDQVFSQNLDLILTVPNASPPVCRMMEVGKYHYEKQREERRARKLQREKSAEVKLLKFRPNTDKHDYDFKIRAAQKFLSRGDQVRIQMQFKSEESIRFLDGEGLCQKILDDLADLGRIVSPLKLSNRVMSATLASKKVAASSD
ncbi:hypothetical protein QBZ16_003702 [Prototheca wickerhamii]|uniref:Translation initiation factor IF-3 n=1 Tax=Prototheca wickerhamii TaxID=3111 RepID=A0AAD9IMA5_PROWI|nr:hypothetical protein QBZ16_003702 [Prototheca wickerhamii]